MNHETAQKLFNYMQDEHGVTLLETDIQAIERIICPELMEYNKPLKGWVNVYYRPAQERYYLGEIRDTKEKCDKASDSKRVACIDLGKYYEREGL